MRLNAKRVMAVGGASVDNDLCMPTAKEQDVFAEDFLDGLVGNHDIYRIFGPSCRTFSQSMFQNFSRLWENSRHVIGNCHS